MFFADFQEETIFVHFWTISQETVFMRNFAMKKYSVIIGILFAAFCLLSIAATPGYAYIVYPDDPYWGPDDRTAAENPDNAGTAGISAEQPRSGNASLKLTLGGSEKDSVEERVEEDRDDWAFYTRTADEGESWGLLSEVSALSFDWYVGEIDTETNEVADNDPFNWQTPVLRLLIEDEGTFSELVWEQYYTDGSDTFEMGQWFTEDLMDDQYFWCYIVDEGYTLTTGDVIENYLEDAADVLLAQTLFDWLDYYSENAIVYGISLGVGSNWLGTYVGYVDNILLSFTTGANEESSTYTVLNDNFELPVPEPSTMLLLGTCLATFLAGRRRRARG